MNKYVKTFESFVKPLKSNESFIIGNYPLEDSLKGKEHLSHLISSIDSFMEYITKEMENERTEDYDAIAYKLSSDIKEFGEEARLLQDGILDYLFISNQKTSDIE